MSEFNLKTLKLEGQLSKFTNIVTGYKFRFFMVNTGLARLDYFMAEDMKHQKPRGSIELENAVISPSEEDSTTFLIHTIDNELFKLRAQDAKERQHWVNVLRFVSQSKSTESDLTFTDFNDSLRRQSLKTYSQVASEKCTFELVKEVLNQVKTNQANLDQLINNLPLKSSLFPRHDKDILILKATARACTNCVTECCSIIKSIQNKKIGNSKFNAVTKSLTVKKQMHYEKKTDLKQNISSYPFSQLSLSPTDLYNGAKSDYVTSILQKPSAQQNLKKQNSPSSLGTQQSVPNSFKQTSSNEKEKTNLENENLENENLVLEMGKNVSDNNNREFQEKLTIQNVQTKRNIINF